MNPHQKRRNNIRNIAIVAHVDHGKTTLVDALLSQSGAYHFKDGETTIMDSNDLERERGITIFSKNASFMYHGVRMNIVDTPGHADFGSEVERILRMVDGVLLLVDAFEGPMPQTKFVLRKSLELHLKPILVINKIDRPNARPHAVTDLTFDLFCELGATDEQLDFPVIFTSAKYGWSTVKAETPGTDMTPLMEAMLHAVMPPIADPNLPFQMLVTMLDYDAYVGQIAIGRIVHGSVRVGHPVALVQRDGAVTRSKVTKLLMYDGLKKVEVQQAEAGDIISLAGADGVRVGDTLASPDRPEALPSIHIDEPTISVFFSHNTSPLSGKDGGKFLTSRHIRERLMHEALVNVGIKVEPDPTSERFQVSGRGELHLAILIETMRREGYELEVSRPEVILRTIDGHVHEPVEEVIIEVDPGYEGAVMQAIGRRKAELKNMQTSAVGTIRMECHMASRAFMGFRNQLLMMTRGTGMMYHLFYAYQPFKGELPQRQSGVMIAHAAGQAVAYALFGLQARGEIFVRPQDALYEGVIIGVNNKGHDMVVNAIRQKQLTNMRAAGSDDAIQLISPRDMTLEFALEFIERDELVEITPKHIRLRKRYLTEQERRAARRREQGD